MTKEGEVCKNKHTHEVVTVKRAETVVSVPENITVYVLSNGAWWEAELFLTHHEKLLSD